MIKAIVAINQDNVIGVDGTIPWHSKGDLKHFKETTTGHVVIMGRKTFESIGNKALPGRVNVVLRRSGHIDLSKRIPKDTQLFTADDLDNAIVSMSEKYPDKDIFIIGGESVYKQSLDICEELIVTEISCYVENSDSNSYFPKIQNMYDVWENYMSIHIKDHRDPFTIHYYKRLK